MLSRTDISFILEQALNQDHTKTPWGYMNTQKDLWVVLKIPSKLLKNRFSCLLMFWAGKLCPVFAHECQMSHSHISTVPCTDEPAGDPLTPRSGAQLSPLGKKILIKEGKKTQQTIPSWYLSVEFALPSRSWVPDWSYGHAWKPTGPVAGDHHESISARSKHALSLRFMLLNV